MVNLKTSFTILDIVNVKLNGGDDASATVGGEFLAPIADGTSVVYTRNPDTIPTFPVLVIEMDKGAGTVLNGTVAVLASGSAEVETDVIFPGLTYSVGTNLKLAKGTIDGVTRLFVVPDGTAPYDATAGTGVEGITAVGDTIIGFVTGLNGDNVRIRVKL